MSVLKDVRLHCLDCCCGQASEVKNCPSKRCPLWEYRFGKSGCTRSMTEEQKQAAAERLKSARMAKKSLTNNEEISD